jgi:hypothetical protein
MYRTFLSILISVTVMFSAGSQSLEIGFQSGIGTYSMKELKNLNYSRQESLPFEAKQISDFPAYIYYRPYLEFKFKKFSVGMVNTFQSTGSRLSAQDYSAEYLLDMKVKANTPGIYGSIDLLPSDKLDVSLSSIFGLAFSNLEIDEYFVITDINVLDTNYKLKAMNYFFEPGFSLSYPVGAFGFGTYFGYLLQFGQQPFHLGDNKDNALYDEKTGKPVGPGWNGLRAGLSVSFRIKVK